MTDKVEKKEKRQVLISPEGFLMFPFLTHACTSFDEKGVYKTDLVVAPSDMAVQKFLKGIQEFLKKHMPKGGHVPYKKQVDEAGEETGNYVVSFKSQFKPGIFDVRNNEFPPEIIVGAGSKAKVAYVLNFYKGFGGGVNLYLQAVQIIDLVEYRGKSAESFGFTAEESQEAPEANPAEEAANKKTDDGDGNLPF